MSRYNLSSARTKFLGFQQIPAAKIAAWVERQFPDHKTRKGGAELIICNPFDGDIGYHFNINPQKGVCHDWRGDNEWAGAINPKTGHRNCSFVHFVRLYRKCSYAEAIKEILGTTTDISAYLRPEARVRDHDLATIAVQLPAGTAKLGPADDKMAKMLKYWLKSRGYTEEGIVQADLYYLGMNVYWPFFEFEHLVYWQSRSRLNKRFEFPSINVTNEKGEIIGKTEGSKSEFLYGFDEATVSSYLIITESIFGQNTLGAQALASGGAALTTQQVNKLKLLDPKDGVILSPDNDKAGIKSIIDNYERLKCHRYPVFYSLPPRLRYEKDGVVGHTKDFNELFEHCHLSLPEIRKLHDDNIKRVSQQELLHLWKLLARQ